MNFRNQNGGLVTNDPTGPVAIEWERGEEIFIERFESNRQLVGHRVEVGQLPEWREVPIRDMHPDELTPCPHRWGWSPVSERQGFEDARQRWLVAC